MTHELECVGLPADDTPASRHLLSELAEAGSREKRPDLIGDMILWVDKPSGAAAIFNTDREGRIVCLRPAFTSGAHFKGIVTGFSPDQERCRFCDLLLATQPLPGSDAQPPFVFHLGNAGVTRQDAKVGGSVDLIVSGFARGIRTWATVAEYRASAGGDDAHPRMMGMAHHPHRPTAAQYTVIGVVLRADRRRNSATGNEFWSLWVDAPFGDGSNWEILANAADVANDIEPGNVIEAKVWACAMLVGQ